HGFSGAVTYEDRYLAELLEQRVLKATLRKVGLLVTNAQEGNVSRGSSPIIRELIVIAKPEVGLQVTREGITSLQGADTNSLANLLAAEGATLKPLFGANEERLKSAATSIRANTGADVPDLSVY